MAFHFQTKAFQDNYVMVRKPALEVMKYLNMADYDMPAIRYILCILSNRQVTAFELHKLPCPFDHQVLTVVVVRLNTHKMVMAELVRRTLWATSCITVRCRTG